MRATVNPKEMALALKHVKPVLPLFKRAAFVRVTLKAADQLIRLETSDDIFATFACQVDEFGQCEIPWQAVSRVLATYKRQACVTIRSDKDGFWIEKLRFPHVI